MLDKFLGQAKDFTKCSKEYQADFAWMGDYKNYQRMCRKSGLNPRYYWDKK